MKIAVALRTCGTVYNYWNSPDRIVDADKETIILTCLNSLLKTIKSSSHEILFSVHDDSSSNKLLNDIGELCTKYSVSGELINSGKLKNFTTQYEWIKQQKCDYVYCVEDDYLHKTNALDGMIDMCEYMKDFFSGEYAAYPFNNPHRYNSFDMLYPSYILKGKDQYWRSLFHSTHTFFISKSAFDKYDDIMRFQAYNWATESNDWLEDFTINKIWRSQEVRLLTPLDSLAFHLADTSQEDTFSNWRKIWNDNIL